MVGGTVGGLGAAIGGSIGWRAEEFAGEIQRKRTRFSTKINNVDLP